MDNTIRGVSEGAVPVVERGAAARHISLCVLRGTGFRLVVLLTFSWVCTVKYFSSRPATYV